MALLHIDIESEPFGKLAVAVDLGKVYDLHWTDPAYADASGPIAHFERSRRFKHCGAAIAWARRKIFHGEVFGASIEMRTITLSSFEGKVREHEDDVVDITLAGFCQWGEGSDYTNRQKHFSLGKPVRKCRAAAL